jgi:hypothetical protein
MPEELRKRSIQDHIQYIGVAGLNLTLGEFLAEYVARATKTISWQKVAAKGLTKGIWSGALLYVGSKVNDDKLARTLEIAAYANMATWILDIIYQLYPGGLWGIVQTLTMRGKVTSIPTGAPSMKNTSNLQLNVRQMPRPGIIAARLSSPISPTAAQLSSPQLPSPSQLPLGALRPAQVAAGKGY